MINVSEYYFNYASVKSRGVNDDDSVYTVTVHKNPVKKKGFELVSSLKPQIDKEYLSSSVNNKICVVSDDKENDGEFDEYEFERFNNSISRTRQSIIQLVANNPWEYFVTLSISSESDADRYDFDDCKKKIMQFFVNYSRRSGAESGFKYLLIPEQHKDGAWHFHGVMMGINKDDLFVNDNGYLDFKPYRDRFGFFSAGRKASSNNNDCQMGKIKDLKKCASYITKYICKDMFIGKQMKDYKHLYFASKGLKRDEVLLVGTPVIDVNDFLDSGHNVWDGEYCTKVVFDDKEKSLECVEPFPNEMKYGVNVNAFGERLPLDAEKKKSLIRRKVYQLCNYLGLQSPNEDVSIDAVWKYIRDNYCHLLDKYDALKEELRAKREKMKNFLNGLHEFKERLPVHFIHPEFAPTSDVYENMVLQI